MNISERVERAAELKRHQGYNCCQAVTAVLTDQTELTEEQMNHIAAGFCVGMGNMEATCGALIGAGMIAGLATNGSATVRFTKQISETFKDMCGAITCKTLKGIPGGKVLCPCDVCVKNAVLAYGKVMGLE